MGGSIEIWIGKPDFGAAGAAWGTTIPENSYCENLKVLCSFCVNTRILNCAKLESGSGE